MKRRSSTRPQPEPTFFVDRNWGKYQLAALLRDAGFSVKAHDDYFHEKTKDEEWIPEVCKEQWIILTGDKRIGFNDREIDAIMVHCGRAYLPKGKMGPVEFGQLIIATRTRILRHVKQQSKHRAMAYMAKVCRPDTNSLSDSGSVERWIDEAKWQEKIRNRTK